MASVSFASADTLTSVESFNLCAAEYLGHCDFYQICVERSFPCGQKSYALAFGQKYCEKFGRVHDGSPYLAGFVGKTRMSLQRDLVAYINRHGGIGSCRQLEAFAFQSHSSAYVEQPFGICHLYDIKALRTIITTIDEVDMLRPQLWQSSLTVASQCAKRIFWPITHRFARSVRFVAPD